MIQVYKDYGFGIAQMSNYANVITYKDGLGVTAEVTKISNGVKISFSGTPILSTYFYLEPFVRIPTSLIINSENVNIVTYGSGCSVDTCFSQWYKNDGTSFNSTAGFKIAKGSTTTYNLTAEVSNLLNSYDSFVFRPRFSFANSTDDKYVTIKFDFPNGGNTLTESSFEKNGNAVLIPTEATVHAELNSDWSATLEHPIDEEGRWKYLEENNVVKMPSFNGDQLFRIKNTEKKDSGISCEMEPIFFDAKEDCWLSDVRPTDKNGIDALNLMLAGNSKYSASSDITTKSTAYYQFKNFLEALNGDDSNSFINRWGGEIEYDNFTVKVNKRIGEDNGVTLLYGKNIKEDGLTEEVDIRDVVTRIYPKAYNGYTMTNNGYVDSPSIGVYPNVHCATITFDDVKMAEDARNDESSGTVVCNSQKELDAALTEKCNAQFDAGLDKPTVTIEADMILLENSEEYKDFKALESVGFGDTIHCKHSKLGIVTEARVIEMNYDSVHDRVDSVVLGDFQYNYLKDVSSKINDITNRIDDVISEDGTVIADRIRGFIDGTQASLKAQYNSSAKADYVALLFENLDSSSALYGALGIGTQGIMISKTRNSTDTDWDWTTAITSSGIIADTIAAGLLSDKKGNNYWDLDKGEFVCKNGTFSGTLNGASGVFSGELKAATGTFTGDLTAGTVGGWNISEKSISKGDVALEILYDGTGVIRFGNGSLSCESIIDDETGFYMGASAMAFGELFGDGTHDQANAHLYLWNPLTATGGNHLVTNGVGLVHELSSSSKRYKDIERDMTEDDLEDLYKIQPVIAKYKENYLDSSDERYQKTMPMFIAEDVDEHFPIAANHNDDGTVEDWNYRVMIPAMFQMIKTQKATIDDLTARLEALEKKVNS